MPNFYNFTQDGLSYNFDDIFVPADAFRQGNLWTWGDNAYAQLGGTNPPGDSPTPVTIFVGGINWKQISAGAFHCTAVKNDGTLWTWGRSNGGQIGNNVIIGINGGVSFPVTTFAGGTNWKQVGCGSNNTFAIKTDGTLWTWGNNFNGGLGDNTTVNRCTPVTTFAGGTNWKQVSGGAAIKTDGTLWTWGASTNNGQLGVNDTSARLTPVTTFSGGTNWKQVSSGLGQHTAAIKTDGTLWVWGSNSYGQIGDTTLGSNRLTPVTTFAGGTDWKQVSSGYRHTAAIKTDGTLWVWGRNNYGQLGDNTTTNRVVPVTTFSGGTNWKQVSAGFHHCTAIKTDGTLWTWGRNSDGQLGNNIFAVGRSTPVTTFAGGTNWKQVVSGYRSTAAFIYIDDYQ